MLHHSWTPPDYAALGRDQVLADKTSFLSRLLKETLK
jgi:hypothetical protein